MIIIWDNGCAYSDKTIAFIETPGMTPEIEAVLLAKGWRHEEPKIVATAEAVAWRDPKAVMTLHQWWLAHENRFDNDDPILLVAKALRLDEELPPMLETRC